LTVIALVANSLQSLLSFIPKLALVVGFFARLLTLVLPAAALRSLVSFVMKDPPTHARDTTCTFLRSRGGVEQALYVLIFLSPGHI
jgi:hypothetical protein